MARVFFFFQAEDGIRDVAVTGVQTCALPIFFWTTCWAMNLEQQEIKSVVQKGDARCHACDMLGEVTAHFRLHGAVAEPISVEFVRSEERRVGKECRSRWSPYH